MFLTTFSELLGRNLRSLSLGKLAISDAQLGNKFQIEVKRTCLRFLSVETHLIIQGLLIRLNLPQSFNYKRPTFELIDFV